MSKRIQRITNRPATCYTEAKQQALKKANKLSLRYEIADTKAFLAICGCPECDAPKVKGKAQGCHPIDDCRKWRGPKTLEAMWAKQKEILLSAGFQAKQLVPRLQMS